MERQTIVLILFSFLFVCSANAQSTRPSTARVNAVRVACCGDSITRRPVGSAYSDQLAAMLGEGWEVRNFGHDGARALKDAGTPYWEQPEFAATGAFKPDVVILMLGTNDASLPEENRKHFKDHLLALVRHFQSLPSKPRVILMTPPPLMPGRDEARLTVLKNELAPIVRAIATDNGLDMVELQKDRAMSDPSLYPDKVHPNKDGAKIIAERVLDVIQTRALPSSRSATAPADARQKP